MARMVREEAPEITRVIGIAMAGVPIVAGMSVMGDIPGGFTRKMENVKSPEEFREVIGRVRRARPSGRGTDRGRQARPRR